MKLHTYLFLFALLLFFNESAAQTNNVTYDEAINIAVEKEYPEYFSALLKILDDFEQEIIVKSVITDGTYKNYTNLLKEISRDSTYAIVSDFALGDSLKVIAKHHNYELAKTLKTVPLIHFRNKAQPKSILFNQRVSEITAKKGGFSRSDYASLLLEVYDEEDYQQPTIRTQLFRFLDPNTDYLLYFYVGKPTSTNN
ncbi:MULTISPECIES: hypothetical protein [unclassified Maribacter]|uniref:hypothetical protein n=1 Tax=unclassified Maribacter TaxID=2615042 RepID=UPI002579A0D7|nr:MULTISPECIES: hypothetical protein [unclassified Maribacter]|tara:strand:+ start:256 stop:846 length:591 start_codon:yes stop_codon:yes gene_type:complete